MLVTMPGCSPGSNHVGAIDTCTAHVIWPSGVARARGGEAARKSAMISAGPSGRTQVGNRMGPS